ncbi:MAG: FtsX-like permease family protein [Paeniclostridium sordellii]|nr:FtsX-like permease family protein [Paeniclostridium sordellii]
MRKKLNLGLRYMQTYKARSFAIILSMVLSVAMIVGILTLTKTEDMNSLQTMKYNTGIYHTTFKNLNDKQLKIIENSENLENVGAFNFHGITTDKEKQSVIMVNCNEDYIISNSKLEKGRFAKNKNEIVAEEWVLKNLGLEPKLNQTIKLNIEDTSKNIKDEEFKLVGIIKDRPTEKQIGKMQMYLPLQKNSEHLEVGLAFNEKIDIPIYIEELAKKANVNKDNISSLDDLITISRDANNVSLNTVLSALVISLICGVVVYSIFNISMYKRFKEYGILRAIGARNFKVFKLILNELMTLSLIGIPIGTVLGIIVSAISNKYASELKTNIALNGEIIKLHMIYPIVEIILAILFMIVILLLIAFFTYRKINKLSIIDAIKGNRKSDNMKKNIITVKTLRKYMKTYKSISFKNIWRNKKRCIMIILSMSICGILFINSNYKSHLDQSDDFIVDRFMFNNSDMRIDVYGTGNQRVGLSKEDINKIETIDGVKEVVKSQIMNGRMVMDEKDIAIKGYFENINKSSRGEGLSKGYLVKDKLNNELILKQNLRGYDDKALKELNNYLVEGSIDIERMKNEDLAVIYIPRVVDEKHGGKIEYNIVDNGKPVSDIKVGDTVKVKYPKGKIDVEKYWKGIGDYDFIEKSFKVGAIVDYPFADDNMYSGDCGVDVIVSDSNLKDMTGLGNYDLVYVNQEKGFDHKKINQELGKIGSKVSGTTTTDMTKEKEDNQKMNQKIMLYNYGIIAVMFTISIFNIINNVSYSLTSRTSEFGMLRAVGISEEKFKYMIIFEGLLYGVVSSLIVIIVGVLLQLHIYNEFRFESLGMNFKILYVDYILITITNIAIGLLSTYFPARKIKKSSIVESINIIE